MDTESFISRHKKDLIMIGIIVLLYILFSFISVGFFSVNTFFNLLRQSAAMAIVAFGMTFIILTGGIDLSVGSSIALIGAVSALSMQYLQQLQTPDSIVFLVGLLVTLFAAVILGAINGVIIGYLQVNAFIVTLAMMSISRGITMTILNSNRVLIKNDYYNFLGQARFLKRIPVSIILVIIAGVFAHLLLTKSILGRRIYAIGGNPIAARAAGINIRNQTFWVYVLANVFVGLAAIIIAGRAKSAQPLAANGFEFEVITAVVLGGCNLLGGEGSIKGTVLGVIAMAIIKTGLSMFSITPFWDYLVKGLLILVAVLLNRIEVFDWKRLKGGCWRSKETAGAPEDVIVNNGDMQSLELKNISKRFPGVVALDNVSLLIERGKVHALCGENGAGKSTLIKILSGVYSKDEGEILLGGKPVNIKSPVDSRKMGISVIYQELTTVPELNIYQNIFLGKEISNFFVLQINKMKEISRSLLNRLKLDLNLTQKIGTLTVGQQQMVEIAKAVGSDSWILIMDEPTSSITEEDKKQLFDIIRELKSQGIAVVYITHRMEEILEIADTVSVLRDGKKIATLPIEEVTERKLIKLMIGHEINDLFSREKVITKNVILEVKDLYRKNKFGPLSFQLHQGEVLGFSGLIGAGRTEIMRCLFGLDKPDGGEIFINGEKVEISEPRDAINHGLVYVSEDRRREGIIPLMSVKENIALPSLPWMNHMGWVDEKGELELSEKYIDELEIKTPSGRQKIQNLSGGNQQKVCVGKWLAREPQIIIMDEPTRGIDIGAKSEIHKIINELTKRDIGVILISSEMNEIINSSDNVIVLYKGQIKAKHPSDGTLTKEFILTAASGLSS